ncbi:MAG: rhomboid family intramembrane serine protease [Phycisphaeraceae bacterium]|nr:rhomboid family intramembrane serine protease [Phycisphaeraceae bacterium]
MLLIPLRTDRPLQRTPWVTYSLLVLNFVFFALMYAHLVPPDQMPMDLDQWLLYPTEPRWFQFITYQFLHGGYFHLFGNMVFLFVFGCSLEDRLGRIGYLTFYLAGGVMAGVGHMLTSNSPVLGASGSIAAVTGAYLVLFPLSKITIFYWFVFLIGVMEISSILLICYQIIQNILFSILPGTGNVAYVAHLAGYGFGFFVAMMLLRFGILARERYDLKSLMDHRRRRREFQRVVRRHGAPWEAEPVGRAAPARSPGRAAESKPDRPPSPQEAAIVKQRALIYQLLDEHKVEDAAKAYIRLLGLDDRQVLSRDAQVLICNQLVSMGETEAAAQGLERFLRTWPADADRDELSLLLGTLYARYLDRPDQARSTLEPLLSKLRDDSLRDMASQILHELGRSSPPAPEGST